MYGLPVVSAAGQQPPARPQITIQGVLLLTGIFVGNFDLIPSTSSLRTTTNRNKIMSSQQVNTHVFL